MNPEQLLNSTLAQIIAGPQPIHMTGYIFTQEQLSMIISGCIIVGFFIGLLLGYYKGSHPKTTSEKHRWNAHLEAEIVRQQKEAWAEKKSRIDEVAKRFNGGQK